MLKLIKRAFHSANSSFSKYCYDLNYPIFGSTRLFDEYTFILLPKISGLHVYLRDHVYLIVESNANTWQQMQKSGNKHILTTSFFQVSKTKGVPSHTPKRMVVVYELFGNLPVLLGIHNRVDTVSKNASNSVK